MAADNSSSSITDRIGGSRASWIIILGAALFVVPEPITSVLGVLVILVGIVAWLVGTAL